ncbi:hypothetical protein F5Y17DRAFT_460679 [Xylariaceae sp. FL0594]|nr:hypothetical protein F5Y17DRAFT_460679 [Xylariaceae sp. FL0594]
MSHFSGSPVSTTDEPKPTYDGPASTPSTPPNGKNRHSVYANDSPGTTKSDFFSRRGHARAASTSLAQRSSLWLDHDKSPVAYTPVPAADHSRSRSRSSSRPLSMIQTYQPPHMDVNADTIPELQPIFTFLNSHANKLYHEGYFVKLDDQNTQGKPNPDRTWTECFAQLVGTVLSLWDAAELDAGGEGSEVLPKFINLTDASIRMIESLPMHDQQPLQNILSITTAGKNRYFLHFNSRHSLIQWTSGIRLAMFEHATLQEAYTGALIAGKGKNLNNIGVIMERSRVPVEQWVRVRFGAGLPWRRCWCVICPPDEKEYQKAVKGHKKKNPYDRSHPPTLKGDIKFYEQKKEGKKQKKVQPVATINDAYSAYAIYPQAKSLIDASTLIKVEGDITFHGDPPAYTEGFVFVMPEVNPAVSGFEMMLRFLFPTWDTFGLYGRPGRLVASVLDSRSLMFAMPKHKHYGYLELLDVESLILTEESAGWNEREWRKKLKELTGTRMNTLDEDERGNPGRTTSRKKRVSISNGSNGTAKARVGFADEAPSGVRNRRSMSLNSGPDGRNESAPPRDRNIAASDQIQNNSDSDLAGSILPHIPLQSESLNAAPGRGPTTTHPHANDLAATPERSSSDEERIGTPPVRDFEGIRRMQTPEPVSQPPAFSHGPGDKPNNRPYHSPEMRRANSRLSLNTLRQLAKASGAPVGQDAWGPESERRSDERGEASHQYPDRGVPSPVHLHVDNTGMPANNGSREALMKNAPRSPGLPPDLDSASQRSRSPFSPATDHRPDHSGPNYNYRPKTPTSRPGTASGSRPPGSPTHGPLHGNPHGNLRGPPTGPLPGPPRMPPPGGGRGRPSNNMPQNGRGYTPQGPAGMHQPGPPGAGGRGRPKTPPPSRSQPLPAFNTSPPVHRKPLPIRSDSLQKRPGLGVAIPVAESANNGSAAGGRIDDVGFGQARTHGPNQPPSEQGRRRNVTMDSQSSSRYDDGASASSPDYASSRPSTETAASIERPRAGVLRTIGATEDSETREPSFEIPGIDFGPTLNYAVAPRSMTSSGAVTRSSTSPPPQSHSPATTLSLRPAVPDSAHSRKNSEENVRRSVVWQPGSAVVASPNSNGPALSPEEFVQHRAATAATPLYAHQRHSSGITISGYRAGTPTPPLSRGQDHDYIGTAHSRNNSQDLYQRPGSRGAGDFLQRPASRGAGEMLQRPSSRGAGELLQRPGSRGAGDLLQRPRSRDLLQRPGSRGAGAVLGGQQSQGESSLSAREQEHVARVTGSPLISLAGNNKSAQPAGGGLIGAIQAREREKEHMKQGWASQAAQTAIQRQQQHQGYQYQQPMASPGLPPPAGMYSNMGRGMVPQSPRQQGFAMQEALWAPGSGGFRSPTPGSMDPRLMASQVQFASSTPFPGAGGPHGSSPGAGRGQNPNGYHGQAF